MSNQESPARRQEFVRVAAGLFVLLFPVRLALALMVAPEIPFYDEWDAVIDGMWIVAATQRCDPAARSPLPDVRCCHVRPERLFRCSQSGLGATVLHFRLSCRLRQDILPVCARNVLILALF